MTARGDTVSPNVAGRGSGGTAHPVDPALPGVCHVISSFHPVVGGAERRTQRICAALRQSGVDVVVLTRRYPGLARHDVVDGVPVRRLGLPSRSKIGALSFLLHGVWMLSTRLRAYRLIHAQSLHTPLLIGLVARILLGRRLLVTLPSEPKQQLGQVGGIRIWFMKRWVDTYGALSDGLGDEMARAGFPSPRIRLLSGGVDTRRFAPPDESHRLAVREDLRVGEGLVALWVGRLVPLKRVDLLVRAWAAREGASGTLLIVGDGPELPSLEALQRELPARGVRFEGAADDVLPYLHAADTFVLCSQREGVSNALLEAMAAGVTPIVSDLPSLREIVADGEAGLVCERDDMRSLLVALQRVEDSHLRSQLGRAARARVRERYSLESAVQDHSVAYGALISPVVAG